MTATGTSGCAAIRYVLNYTILSIHQDVRCGRLRKYCYGNESDRHQEEASNTDQDAGGITPTFSGLMTSTASATWARRQGSTSPAAFHLHKHLTWYSELGSNQRPSQCE